MKVVTSFITCPRCSGKKFIINVNLTSLEDFTKQMANPIRKECPRCKGKGRVRDTHWI